MFKSVYNWASKTITVTAGYGTSLHQDTTETLDANGNPVSVADALTHADTTTYNSRGWISATADALSRSYSSAFNADGAVTSRTNARGKTSTDTVDQLDRTTASTSPTGDKTQTVYDSDNNPVQTISPKGEVSQTVFDALDQPVYQVDARGGVTKFVRDADGNLLSETDSVGNTTQWMYDEDGNKIEEILPTGGTYVWTYDNANRQITQVDPNNREIDTSYYANGWMSGQVWKNSSGTTVNTLSWTYDGDGRTLTASDNSGTWTFTYDALGRKATQTDTWGIVITYGYDAGNRETSATDSLGGSRTMTYDNANELTGIAYTDSTTGATLSEAIIYNADGQVQEVDRYSDSGYTTLIGKTVTTVDNSDRVTVIDHQDASGTTIDKFNYTYNTDSEITQETSTLGPTKNNTYDANGQITGDGTSTYNWDSNGNSTNTGFSTSTGNQLTTDGTWNYYYDAVGNETSKVNISTGEVWNYGYDNANRLVQATHQPSSSGSVDFEEDFTYDVYGNMTERDVYPTGPGGSVTVTKEAYEDGNAIADLSSALAVQYRRLYSGGLDSLFARSDASGNVAWYLDDVIGSVRGLTDNTGSLIDQIDYNVWGAKTYESTPANGDRYTFASREWDANLSLYYNRARWFDPATKRWMSQDPLGFDAGDSNLYRYCNNAPTAANDPTGSQQEATLPINVAVPKGYEDTYKGFSTKVYEPLNPLLDVILAGLPANGTKLHENNFSPNFNQGVIQPRDTYSLAVSDWKAKHGAGWDIQPVAFHLAKNGLRFAKLQKDLGAISFPPRQGGKFDGIECVLLIPYLKDGKHDWLRILETKKIQTANFVVTEGYWVYSAKNKQGEVKYFAVDYSEKARTLVHSPYGLDYVDFLFDLKQDYPGSSIIFGRSTEAINFYGKAKDQVKFRTEAEMKEFADILAKVPTYFKIGDRASIMKTYKIAPQDIFPGQF